MPTVASCPSVLGSTGPNVVTEYTPFPIAPDLNPLGFSCSIPYFIVTPVDFSVLCKFLSGYFEPDVAQFLIDGFSKVSEMGFLVPFSRVFY